MSTLFSVGLALQPQPWLAILRRSACRSFDITQAFIGFGLLGAKPFKILRHIAGGVFGSRASEMGWTSVLTGLACQITALTAAGRK